MENFIYGLVICDKDFALALFLIPPLFFHFGLSTGYAQGFYTDHHVNAPSCKPDREREINILHKLWYTIAVNEASLKYKIV